MDLFFPNVVQLMAEVDNMKCRINQLMDQSDYQSEYHKNKKKDWDTCHSRDTVRYGKHGQRRRHCASNDCQDEHSHDSDDDDHHDDVDDLRGLVLELDKKIVAQTALINSLKCASSSSA
jgi:hypothetical protein